MKIQVDSYKRYTATVPGAGRQEDIRFQMENGTIRCLNYTIYGSGFDLGNASQARAVASLLNMWADDVDPPAPPAIPPADDLDDATGQGRC